METRKPLRHSPKPIRFNGATSSRTWKPRPGDLRRTGAGCFNGATSSRTWKRLLGSGSGGGNFRFNGATSSRTWKHSAEWGEPASFPTLQWSHVLTNVETCEASMSSRSTPSLQWSHVLTNVETALCCIRKTGFAARFNGATSSRTWKLPSSYFAQSMERLLQWSHVLTNVETPGGTIWLDRDAVASMEPRPHERGNSKEARRQKV